MNLIGSISTLFDEKDKCDVFEVTDQCKGLNCSLLLYDELLNVYRVVSIVKHLFE